LNRTVTKNDNKKPKRELEAPIDIKKHKREPSEELK
jgi:hypothetical protein